MERLKVRVRSVSRSAEGDVAVARVVAVSERRVGGRPAARIELEVTFEAAGLTQGQLKDHARLAALDYLDVE